MCISSMLLSGIIFRHGENVSDRSSRIAVGCCCLAGRSSYDASMFDCARLVATCMICALYRLLLLLKNEIGGYPQRLRRLEKGVVDVDVTVCGLVIFFAINAL